MLFEEQKVKIKWNNANRIYYMSKGYLYTKNGEEFEIDIRDISKSSHSLVKFICDYCNGENQIEEKSKYKTYKNLITQRKSTNKDCCNHDICRAKKMNESRIDNIINSDINVAATHPHLLKEWSNRNTTELNQYTKASDVRAWWLCEKGHEWETEIKNRVKEHGCPYCSGRSVSKENCLANTYSEVAKEWHPIKNDDLTPFDVTCGSHKVVWWLCEFGHEWNATVYHRTNGRNCPICKESKGEKRIREFLLNKSITFISQQEFDELKGVGGQNLRFDFSIFNETNKLVLLIEYDGEFHFKKYYEEQNFETTQIHDERKNKYCEMNGIPLLRIPYWEFDNINSILLSELSKYDLLNLRNLLTNIN